jgi:hypothetical protein
MALRDMLFSVALAVVTGLSGWVWSMYDNVHVRTQTLERSTAVLEVSKADKGEISVIREQLVRQTTLMERQIEISAQHAKLLERLMEKGS